MRLVIDLDEKYKNLYYEMAKATEAVIVEEEDTDVAAELPEHIIAGIRKGQEQARNGQTKSYEEVKQMLAKRWP